LLLFTGRRIASTGALADLMRRFTGAEPAARRLSMAAYGMTVLIGVLYVT
jgi:hypothetical protein